MPEQRPGFHFVKSGLRLLAVEMIEPGEDPILARAPRTEIAAPSWASSLAEEVYQAMEAAHYSKQYRSQLHNRAIR